MMLDRENPFSLSKADYLTDRKLIDYFAAPPHLGLLQQVKPVLLRGGRGTGKTMLFRYLSFEVQSAKFLHERHLAGWTPELLDEFWRDLSGFGVYLKLNGGDTHAFKEGRITEAEWTDIFSHYFNMVLSEKTVATIKSAISSGILLNVNEEVIANEVAGVCLKRDNCRTLDELRKMFVSEKNSIERFLKVRAYKDIEYDGIISTVGEPLEVLIQQLRKEGSQLSECPVYILLDEYENLLEPQQRLINTLVKLSSAQISYKLSMRHYGFRTKETTIGNEKLEELHDYTEVVMERDIYGKSSNYRDLLLEISRRRLEHHSAFYNRGMTDIRKILHTMSEDDEAREIVGNDDIHIRNMYKHLLQRTGSAEEANQRIRQLTGHNPLLDKFNHVLITRGKRSLEEIAAGYSEYIGGVRDNWYGTIMNALKPGLVFLLLRDYGKKQRRKQYCGFEVLASLSSTIIRAYLELCERSFYLAQLDERDIPEEGIPARYQTTAAERVAEKFFSEIPDLSAEGKSVQALARELGTIFRTFHVDPSLRAPEVTFFSTYFDKVEPQTRNILESALRHSVLLPKKSMGVKEVGRPVPDDFMLNRIFAPRFGISHRLRNRVLIAPEALSELISDNQLLRSRTRNQITKRRYEVDENQLSFGLDPWGFDGSAFEEE